MSGYRERAAEIIKPANLGCKLTPLGKGSEAVELEIYATVVVTFLVKIIMD